jgi:hypothetical protein
LSFVAPIENAKLMFSDKIKKIIAGYRKSRTFAGKIKI